MRHKTTASDVPKLFPHFSGRTNYGQLNGAIFFKINQFFVIDCNHKRTVFVLCQSNLYIL